MEYAWNTRFKQTVINEVFNKRFKRFKFVEAETRDAAEEANRALIAGLQHELTR